MPAPSPPPEPRCPRCGYDLSGQVATWADACPLEGVCTECGLGLHWSAILGQAANPPRWSAEHAPFHALPSRIPATALRALWPRRFWSALRMDHEVRVARLVSVAAAVMAMAWVVLLTAGLLSHHAYSSRVPPQWRSRYQLNPERLCAIALEPVFGGRHWVSAPGWLNDPLLLGMVGFTTGVFGSLLIARSARRSRIRVAHLGRAAAWSLSPLVFYFALQGMSALRWSFVELTKPQFVRGAPGPGAIWRFFSTPAPFEGVVMNGAPIWVIAGVCGWVGWFWWSALRTGFEIEKARQIMAAGLALGALLAVGGIAFADIWTLSFLL